MPVLVQTRGPNVGETFPLRERCILGRNPDCDVVVPLESVSRHHARIALRGQSYFLEDLDSRNGTALNDVVIQGRCRLADGDVVKLSGVEFSFREAASKESPLAGIPDTDTHVFVDTGRGGGSAPVQLSLEADPRSASAARAKLHVLLDISQGLAESFSPDHVLPKILDGLFAMLPQAERGCVVLRDDTGRLVPVWTKTASGRSGEQRISRAIVEQAMRGKKALLSSDMPSAATSAGGERATVPLPRSIICAPLVDESGHAFGVVQVETTNWQRSFQQEELELLIGVATQAAMAITITRLHERELKRRTLERDLELAAGMQRQLLPGDVPRLAGYEFADFYQPAEVVGGDYYDYVPLLQGGVAVVIADVAGHSFPAALSMSKLSAEVRLLLATIQDPAEILTTLNANMWRQGLDARFITMLIAVVAPCHHEVTLACAGHMPPILRRGPDALSEPGRNGYGPPLGAITKFDYQRHTFSLQPGDTMTLYTDGITEADNPAREMYGAERLRVQIAQASSPADIVERVIGDLTRFVDLRPHADDICLVAFGRAPGSD